MKKICLLLIPLLLCSCNINNKDSSELSNVSTNEKLSYVIYESDKINSDGYYYWFRLDYNDNAKLIINRKKDNEEYLNYKSFPFGKYETINSKNNNDIVYDYGNYAIWLKH